MPANRRGSDLRNVVVLIVGVALPIVLIPVFAMLRAQSAWFGSLLPTPQIGVGNQVDEVAFVTLTLFGAGAGLALLIGVAVFVLVADGRGSGAVFLVFAYVLARLSGRILKDLYEMGRPAGFEGAGAIVPGLSPLVPLAVAIACVIVGLLVRQRSAVVAGMAVGGLLIVDRSIDVSVPLRHGMESFPSGHALGSMAVVAALVALSWDTRWRWPTLLLGGVLAVGVGASRIYLGVHFVADVLAGWCVAVAIISVAWLAWAWVTRPRGERRPSSASI